MTWTPTMVSSFSAEQPTRQYRQHALCSSAGLVATRVDPADQRALAPHARDAPMSWRSDCAVTIAERKTSSRWSSQARTPRRTRAMLSETAPRPREQNPSTFRPCSNSLHRTTTISRLSREKTSMAPCGPAREARVSSTQPALTQTPRVPAPRALRPFDVARRRRLLPGWRPPGVSTPARFAVSFEQARHRPSRCVSGSPQPERSSVAEQCRVPRRRASDHFVRSSQPQLRRRQPRSRRVLPRGGCTSVGPHRERPAMRAHALVCSVRRAVLDSPDQIAQLYSY